MLSLQRRAACANLQAAHAILPISRQLNPSSSSLTMAALRSSSPTTTATRPAHDTAGSLMAGAQRSSAACSMHATSMAVQ